MSQAYPIPRTLWESLDAVLFTKGLALAKEIAADLGVSPKDLITNLNSQERGKFTVIPDEDAAVYQCQALMHHGVVYMRCRKPTLGLAPRFCKQHERYAMDAPALPMVRRLVTPEATYIVNMATREVTTLNGAGCGILNGERLTLFEIE